MNVSIDPSSLANTRWYEIALRFLLGGAITAVTGVLARQFGPELAGLFLAFPALCAASATLIEKHEKQKKQRLGLEGSGRARQAAALDVAGSSEGSVGLIAFGAICWQLLPDHNPWAVLAFATFIWFVVAWSLWWLRERL